MSACRCLGNTNRLRIRERDRKTSQTDLTSPMSPWRDRRRRPGKIFLTGAQKWRLTESHRGGTSLKSQRRMWDPAWDQKVHIGSSRSSSAGEKVPSGPAWDVQCPVKRARHTGMEALLRLLPPSGCSCKRFVFFLPFFELGVVVVVEAAHLEEDRPPFCRLPDTCRRKWTKYQITFTLWYKKK